MILVAAMTRDHVIGKDGRLPWNIPEEYSHFLSLIRGASVIMGRRSYEVFGDDCTCKHMIVVSRSMLDTPGVHVCRSIDEAMTLAARLGEPVFCAGGAAIYEQTIGRATAMYLSYIHGTYAGDSFFPEFDERDWSVLRREHHREFEFVVYGRPADGDR
jgi:dihydrofolate reductase